MSQTDPDKKSCECKAWGCPMLGTVSRSTNGTTEWFCYLHLSADATKWQDITAELNRLAWLVSATRLIRAYVERPTTFPHPGQDIYRDINLAQRGDLKIKEHETEQQWGVRLEGILAESCAAMVNNRDMIPEAVPA